MLWSTIDGSINPQLCGRPDMEIEECEEFMQCNLIIVFLTFFIHPAQPLICFGVCVFASFCVFVFFWLIGTCTCTFMSTWYVCARLHMV